VVACRGAGPLPTLRTSRSSCRVRSSFASCVYRTLLHCKRNELVANCSGRSRIALPTRNRTRAIAIPGESRLSPTKAGTGASVADRIVSAPSVHGIERMARSRLRNAGPSECVRVRSIGVGLSCFVSAIRHPRPYRQLAHGFESTPTPPKSTATGAALTLASSTSSGTAQALCKVRV